MESRNTKTNAQGAVVWAVLGISVVLGVASQRPATSQAPVVQVSDTNDVMSGAMPKMPSFPRIARKAGRLRGYVKDAQGRPLRGASVMIVPPALFGSAWTSRAIKGKTDANGLYEIPVPVGGCTVYCAGYAIDYRGTRLALPLHPVDGELDSIPPDKGDVENFVVLPYGVASKSSVAENPVYSGGYYGASFTVGYSLTSPGSSYAPPGSIPEGSEVEITLTPDGPLVDGSAGRAFVIRRKLEHGAYFQVNNVPIGSYKIAARLRTEKGVEALRLSENVRRAAKGGLTPKESATGEATVLFRSESADPVILRVPLGNMERLELLIGRVTAD